MELLEYSLLEGALVVTRPKPSTPNKSAARADRDHWPQPLSLQSRSPGPGNQGLWSHPALWSSQPVPQLPVPFPFPNTPLFLEHVWCLILLWLELKARTSGRTRLISSQLPELGVTKPKKLLPAPPPDKACTSGHPGEDADLEKLPSN